jgi:hypothetical protein
LLSRGNGGGTGEIDVALYNPVSKVDNWFQDEDSRIQKLAEFAEKNSGDGPDAVVTFLESLGGKSSIVYGGICFNEGFSMSHFLIMAIIHVNGDGVKLTAQIDAEKAILKTWNKSNIDRQRSFLVAMELYIVKERRKGIARYDEVRYIFSLWIRQTNITNTMLSGA